MYLLARVLQVVGEVLVGFVAIMVHHRVLREHKIDRKVFRSMRREQKIGLLGIALIVTGFAVEVVVTYA